MRNNKNVYERSPGWRSIAGTARLGFVGLPALGLGADGSERTVVGRGRRDAFLDGGGSSGGGALAFAGDG